MRELRSISVAVLVIPAYAKVNLALEVVGRRGDGWHDIDTVIVPIDWHDLVGVGFTAHPGASLSDDDLAARAAAGLTRTAASSARFDGELRVWLTKRIPVAAGLGGGSADAAAVLRAGARLLATRDTDISNDTLITLANKLGSDVPALVETHAVRCTGRGDRVARVSLAPLHLAVVFIAPSSTGDVYRALLPDECRDGGRVARLIDALSAGAELDPDLLGSALEPAACRVNPELAAGAARLRAVLPGARWHMTGSGGAFFSLAADGEAAASLASAASAAGLVARPCRSVAGAP